MSVNLPDIGRAWTPSSKTCPVLPDGFVPAWPSWARLDATGRRIDLLSPRGQVLDTFSFGGQHAAAAWSIVDAIDGQRSLTAIEALTALPPAEVRAVVLRLYEQAALMVGVERELPALAFYEHLRSLVHLADRARGKSPLLERYARKQAGRRLILGYLIETYHFAAAAASHLALAIASAPSVRLQTVFSEHLSEEYWHHAWLERGLHAAGLRHEDIERSVPCTGTLAVIHHLRWLATSDLASYAVCLGVIESGPSLLAAWTEFWDTLAAGELEAAAIAPFREHSLLDCQEGHEAYGAEPFHAFGPLTAGDQARIRQRVSRFRDLTWEQHRSILESYEDEAGPALLMADDCWPLVARPGLARGQR